MQKFVSKKLFLQKIETILITNNQKGRYNYLIFKQGSSDNVTYKLHKEPDIHSQGFPISDV